MRLAIRVPLTRRTSARVLSLLAIGVLLGGSGLLGWVLATSPVRDEDQYAMAVAISVIVIGVPTLGVALYLGGLAFSVAHPGVGVRTLVRRVMLVFVGAASETRTSGQASHLGHSEYRIVSSISIPPLILVYRSLTG